MATFSTSERKRRPRGDRKSQEMTMHLQQTFNAAILTSLHPRSQIDIFVEVKTPFLLILYFTNRIHVKLAYTVSHNHKNIEEKYLLSGLTTLKVLSSLTSW